MEPIQQEGQLGGTPVKRTLAEIVKEQQERLAQLEGKEPENEKKFKLPIKWQFKFRTSRMTTHKDDALVLFFNKKGEIEAPKFMPIKGGDIIVWNNKSYLY